ncbi:hypothetical protein CLU96_1229 [Chryseobacterium sp. 52]|uniref:hypothetical protein n=1 Tax=Chryseobacterium sp. 52 TaxID=2035213 RepID=UPI000C176BE4|nr:hypothetical protein [Chryseobacterium sp. 52]PIF44288.1 hypothetical protein CLU96_1229 [Chryseobacterium sp. 52]
MKEILNIVSPYKEILQEIESTPYHWASYPLPEHPDLPQFNRKLIITGFNCPDLENQNDMRLYITVKQIYTNKETGKIFTSKELPTWTIYADTWSFVRNVNDYTKLVEVDKKTLDDDGAVIKTEKSYIKVGTIPYIKYLLLNKKIHLIDLFSLYLANFAESMKSELDKF